LEKRSRSSMGAALRRSCHTNPMPATIAPTTEASVMPEV